MFVKSKTVNGEPYLPQVVSCEWEQGDKKCQVFIPGIFMFITYTFFNKIFFCEKLNAASINCRRLFQFSFFT